jgi:hypothetical protein
MATERNEEQRHPASFDDNTSGTVFTEDEEKHMADYRIRSTRDMIGLRNRQKALRLSGEFGKGEICSLCHGIAVKMGIEK